MNRVAQISQQKSRQFSISDWLKGTVPNKPTREELVGSEVFVPDADSCFVLGSIVDVQDDGAIVAQTAEDGRKVTSSTYSHTYPLVPLGLSPSIRYGNLNSPGLSL